MRMEPMNYSNTIEMVKRNEGYSDKIYLDSEGLPTGGYGCHLRVGLELPHHIWLKIFEYQYTLVLGEYELLGFKLDDCRKSVVIDMLYNLGLKRFLGFKKMLSAIHAGDYETAAEELKDSKYYLQTKTRAQRNYELMKTGRGDPT